MSRIEEMSQFYSELINESDKLTIRAYKNNFYVKMSPLHFLDRIDINSNLFRFPPPIALWEYACNAIV